MGHGELIGREREVAALSGWLEEALNGRPRLVLCGGEPGIGKTRLASELAEVARRRGVPTVWGRAPEGVAPAPFGLWLQVLSSDPTALAAARASPTEDPEAARFVLFDRVSERIREKAGADGLVVVIDDVQRADEPSLLLLMHLVRNLRGDRLMMLATARTVPSEATQAWQAMLPDLLREPATERLQLGGLTVDDTIRCIASITGRTIDDRAGRLLHRATKGNPFFVTELAWASTTTDEDNGVIAVPESVLEVVARRVEGLSGAAGQLLAVAAVLGEQFSLPVAASLVDRPVTVCLPLLEEAAKAGLVEPSSVRGDWRFSHALVRDALEARIPLADRVCLHRGAAEAIERTYGGQLDHRLADLARHWSVVATTGERDNAVRWAGLAAEEAMRVLAYEESARLFRLALQAGGAGLNDASRGRLLLGLVHAEWRSGRLEACRETCKAVVDTARRTRQPTLLAEAALALEPIGALAWDLDLVMWCKEALAGVDGGDLVLRARLLARLTEASIYAGEEVADETSELALLLADKSDEVTAVVAALRARQLAMSGPEHVDERTILADRMVDAGLLLRRPSIEMWGRLWRIDAHWERGELPAIASALARLEWCVDHVGGPMARWHLLAAGAGLAQATGRFKEALALGVEAFESVRALRHPTAFGAFASLLCPLGHHIGHDRAAEAVLPGAWSGLPVDAGEVRSAIFSHLGPALVLCETGRLDEALAAYRGAGPAEHWRPPPYFRILSWSVGSVVAVALGLRGDVECFYERLREERGRHAVGGAGNVSYFGPVELHLGRAGAYLGRSDEAEADLEAAAAYCRAVGAAGFAVEAECELADALARRGDPDGARALAASAGAEAVRLGMAPWVRRAAAVSATVAGSDRAAGPLSQREREVAELVAEGKTNRSIAEALFLSERTAQTHVQHILTKLGFSNRSQIASWVASHRTD